MRIINGEKFYRPMEVAERGLIQNSRGTEGTIQSHYNYILELIKSRQLLATNYSMGEKRSYWMVSEKAINNFHKRAHRGTVRS